MNPFDLGMIEPTGFFALNNRDLLTTDYKWKFGGKEILYYNPCWTLLGDYATTGLDTQKRSGGSYYYEDSKSRCLYWYLIDQIILRKSLISEFISDSLKIGENAELLETITQKKIKGEKKLDHFPLTISFNFNPE
jgi:hypothetical protein